MRSTTMNRRTPSLLLSLMLAAGSTALAESPAPSGDGPDGQAARAEPQKELFTGKVVLLQDALTRRGIRSYAEMKDQVALETPDGGLVPLLSDWRGRAFFQDGRLRDRKVELIGYRHQGVPYLQVLMVFTFGDEGQRQYTDYWCDICAIPMYEIKLCECCQGDIRLRFQPQDLPEYITGPSP